MALILVSKCPDNPFLNSSVVIGAITNCLSSKRIDATTIATYHIGIRSFNCIIKCIITMCALLRVFLLILSTFCVRYSSCFSFIEAEVCPDHIRMLPEIPLPGRTAPPWRHPKAGVFFPAIPAALQIRSGPKPGTSQ